MNQFYKYIFILSVFSINSATAQNDSVFRLKNTFPYPIESFTVNNLGELYIINTNNQLKKIDEKGDSVGVFNQVTKYGRLTYVEAQNPWKTILFYQNFLVLTEKSKLQAILQWQ